MDGNTGVAEGFTGTEELYEPKTLAEAFRANRELQQIMSQERVEEDERPEPEPAGTEEPGAGQPDDGGSATGQQEDERPDYEAVMRELALGIGKESKARAKKYMQENKMIRVTLDQIAEQDEDTGERRFRNFDMPGEYFQSRSQALAEMDAFNRGIDETEAQITRQFQEELVKQYAPRFQLLRWMNTYDALDNDTKTVLEDMVEPYAITDEQGNVIGYNCNLDRMTTQAKKITARYNEAFSRQQEKAKEQAAVRRPAMENSGNASENTVNDAPKDPKNLSEAFSALKKW